MTLIEKGRLWERPVNTTKFQNGYKHYAISPALNQHDVIESFRNGAYILRLESWVKREARRVGLLIFQFNQIEYAASERLSLDADDEQALFALSICYRWLPRLEYRHDLLLSKDPADWIEVFRSASGKTDRRVYE